jgi:hypothetical protein
MKFCSCQFGVATSAASIVDSPMKSSLKVFVQVFLSPKFMVVMRRGLLEHECQLGVLDARLAMAEFPYFGSLSAALVIKQFSSVTLI